MSVEIEECVLLLNTEPGLLIDALVHHLQARLTLVCVARSAVKLVGIAHDQDVVAAAEGILVDGHRVQIGVRVGALSLVARAAIVIPDGQL